MRSQLSLLSLLLTALVLSSCATQSEEVSPRNMIFFIADGCGPATYSLGRQHVLETQDRPLVFDAIETGSVTTRSANARVTDSASSATAYACALKTKNGMIGVRPDSSAAPTLVEAAEAAGLWTGLVSTARISHATPAAFSAHVASRNSEAEIARQQILQGIEVLFGGGAAFYSPEETGGLRTDGIDLFAEAEGLGYRVLRNADDLEGASSTPVLGLFDPTHMDYEIDRTEQPSLADMTRKALELLSEAPAGFFIMIEAGRIDHAAHANDIGAHLHDFLAYEEAMSVALDFAARNGETLVVATSDHETGGLGLGRDGVYDYHPDVAAAMSRSIEEVLSDVGEAAFAGARGAAFSTAVEGIIAEQHLGSVTADDRAAIDAIAARIGAAADPVIFARAQTDGFLRDLTARAAGVGWTTDGHTAVNVPLYAHGPGAERFKATVDNAELGRMLADALGIRHADAEARTFD